MTRWHRDPSVLWRRSGPRVVALPEGADDGLLLEGVALLIWDRLEQPAATEDLVVELAAVFPDEATSTIRAEVVEFLEQLAGSRLVVRA